MAETVNVPKATLVSLLELVESAIMLLEGEFPGDCDEERHLANELRACVDLPPMKERETA